MLQYANGSEEAFEGLFERYQGRLTSFLNRRLGGPSAVSDDIFQIVWLKIHSARHQFDQDRRFSAWFYQIALNSLRDFGRQRSRKAEIELKPELISDDNSLEEKVILREELENLSTLLMQIPGQQREILLLADSEGLSAKEISEIYQLTEPNVRQQLSRTRKWLRKLKGSGS